MNLDTLTAEYQRRIRDVFTKLSMISEASPPELASSGAKTKPQSSPPIGARLKRLNGDRPPPRDRSLFDFYGWHLRRAQNHYDVVRIVNEAEIAYHRHIKRVPRRELPTDNDAAMKRVVDDYEGLALSEVARLLGNDDESLVPWIEKARRTHNRKVADGTERRPWEKWSHTKRRSEIRSLRESGMTVAQVAAHFEVSERTVQRYSE